MGREHQSKQIAATAVAVALVVILISFFTKSDKVSPVMSEIGVDVGMSYPAVERLAGPFHIATMAIFQSQRADLEGYEFWFVPPVELATNGANNAETLWAVTRKVERNRVFVLPKDMAGKPCNGTIQLHGAMEPGEPSNKAPSGAKR